jgi:hypothetical protein
MPRYSVAFVSAKPSLIHKVVEMDSRESALKYFFQQYVSQGYTQDAEGYSYFLEDFQSPEEPMGNIIEL